jgi:hypothetical protein
MLGGGDHILVVRRCWSLRACWRFSSYTVDVNVVVNVRVAVDVRTKLVMCEGNVTTLEESLSKERSQGSLLRQRSAAVAADLELLKSTHQQALDTAADATARASRLTAELAAATEKVACGAARGSVAGAPPVRLLQVLLFCALCIVLLGCRAAVCSCAYVGCCRSLCLVGWLAVAKRLVHSSVVSALCLHPWPSLPIALLVNS